MPPVIAGGTGGGLGGLALAVGAGAGAGVAVGGGDATWVGVGSGCHVAVGDGKGVGVPKSVGEGSAGADAQVGSAGSQVAVSVPTAAAGRNGMAAPASTAAIGTATTRAPSVRARRRFPCTVSLKRTPRSNERFRPNLSCCDRPFRAVRSIPHGRRWQPGSSRPLQPRHAARVYRRVPPDVGHNVRLQQRDVKERTWRTACTG